ncbi:MAG TPA: hypothetical protein ENG83_01570 [Nitrospirae bacterium]|nr:phosphoenolpyruvate synthase [bacterium BMS3Abin06]HDH10889.1 hypothetical protein [Nitrospirota bacterium]HDL20877.1 hypothetical protein [Nitrospirota bacterium]HDZ03249.1 hypothetical protein [Nitrospirota bacterium]
MTMEEITLKDNVRLQIEKRETDGRVEVSLRMKGNENCLLHWGLSKTLRSAWQIPPQPFWPDGSRAFGQAAVQTPFTGHNNEARIVIRLDKTMDFPVMNFALFFPDTGRWDNNHGKNYHIKLPGLKPSEHETDISDEIIEREMGHHSWTLMHRFNLCHDLADRVGGDTEGLALLYVWLRYSALRQLDWQRNYNTKPKELSHAQDRLTLKLADIYINEPAGRELIRLMITTLGRGGEGQRIRDEILNIMHRHHIKEVSNHFMEEWHQKLHNNTTPDDIVICEAYLEFLRSNGNPDLFYRTLEAGGVTRERLENFERPIVTQPDFIPHLKEGLIYDFENYLKLLKSIHSGTDLESSANAARYLFDDEMHGLMDFIFHHRYDSSMPVADIVGRITAMRRRLNRFLNSDGENGRVRDMLYLDLALEEFLRIAVERNIHMQIDRDQLVELISMVLENIGFSYGDFEFSECLRDWERLKAMPRFSQDWSLRAKSVLDRLGRAIGAFSEHYYRLFQPKAEFLGKAFHADSWAITLFSEEIVRGTVAFILSMLVHHLDPVLRRIAKLGDWQVISPGQAMGLVEVVDTLGSIQGKTFESPTVIIADKVMGDEEPPEGVNVVITPDAVDLVSHVAVRARNAHLLFATCYDKECLDRLKSLKGHLLDLMVNTSGDVVFEEASGEMSIAPSQVKIEYTKIARPVFTTSAISSKDFREGLVGGKSGNLRLLEGKLPDWIHLPVSVALPFGVFEKVLASDNNRKIAERYNELISRIEDNPEEILAEIRKTLLAVQPPEELTTSLYKVMEEAGLGRPENPDDVWSCIRRVWASKWNERAYLSRKARGIPHEDIFMAVLIQQVVEAEYAFVIHTVNPFTRNRNELYAEVVLGLGETLVGNYPGRALGFFSEKEAPEPRILSYPGKSTGLFGGGLIFRSDSNGEDLAGYAGAGLYDSVMLEPPRTVALSYTEEPLIWDEDFRREILTSIANIGIMVEKAAGSPQDIEGAYADGRYYVVQTRAQVG